MYPIKTERKTPLLSVAWNILATVLLRRLNLFVSASSVELPKHFTQSAMLAL